MSEELPEAQASDISYESTRGGQPIRVVLRCMGANRWNVMWFEPGDRSGVRAGDLLRREGGYTAESRTDRWKGDDWRELVALLIRG